MTGLIPVLDSAAAHGLAGDIVRLLEPETEAHPAALLASYLTMFGSAVGAGPHVRIGGDRHPGRLFVAVVGRTARARKGTSGSLIREVFRQADPGWEERVVGGFGSGEAMVDAVHDPIDENDPGPGDHRLFVREPELARILHVAERDGSTLSQIVREAWDGGRLAVRSRTKTVTATGAHISVLADITADELRHTLTRGAISNGFGNRFLYVLVTRSKRLPSGGNLTDEDFAYCASLTAKALVKARQVGRMHRTPEAEQVWTEVYDAIPDDETGLFGSIVARAEAHVLRLSVVYALLDGQRDIDVDHLRAAAALWDYCRASAFAIFATSLGDANADRLFDAIVRAGGDGLDGEEQLAVFSRHISKADLTAARTLLEARGLVVSVKQQTGGRPKLRTYIAQEAQEARERRLLDLPSLSSHPAPLTRAVS